MSREVRMIIGAADEILHVDTEGTVGSLPDSAKFFEAIKTHAKQIVGIAHSHPGFGPQLPSSTDIETFQGLEYWFDRRLQWWVVTQTEVGLCLLDTRRHNGESMIRSVVFLDGREPKWVAEMRRLSYTDALQPNDK